MIRYCLSTLVCLAVLFPLTARALEPAGSLTQVEYVKTITGDEVVVRDSLGDVTVRLIGLSAEPISTGTPDAYDAAAETAALLIGAAEIYLEVASLEHDPDAIEAVWVWYAVKPDAEVYELRLANAGLLRTGKFRFDDTPACDLYRDILLQALAGEPALAEAGDGWVWQTHAGMEPLGYFRPGDGTELDVTMRNYCVVTPAVKEDQPGTWVRVKRSADAAGTPYPLEVMDDGKVVAYFDLVNVSQNHVADIGVQLDYMNKDGRAIAYVRSGVSNLGPEEVRRVAVVIEQLDLKELQYIVY